MEDCRPTAAAFKEDRACNGQESIWVQFEGNDSAAVLLSEVGEKNAF